GRGRVTRRATCRVATCEARQLARLLHRFARARIGGSLVDCDRSWPHSMRLFQCLAKEAPRSGRIALAAQKEIDRLPSAVNGTIKICPPTFHFDVGLVHSPSNRTIDGSNDWFARASASSL